MVDGSIKFEYIHFKKKVNHSNNTPPNYQAEILVCIKCIKHAFIVLKMHLGICKIRVKNIFCSWKIV